MTAIRKLFYLGCTAILLVMAFVHGCKDFGSEPPPRPLITRIEPDSGVVGDQIRIEGQHFGSSRGNSKVLFGLTTALQYDEWRDDEIRVRVPSGAQTGVVRVRTAGGESNGLNFRVLAGSGISFSSDIQPIFTTSCVNAGCHPGGGAPFSLTSGESYNNLVNRQQTSSPLCANLALRVQPFLADSSVLYRRIGGTSCGDQMPRFLPSLSTPDQNLIRDWINQGAQNN